MKNLADRLWLSVKLKSPLMLNWFSVNRETPDCGLEIGQRLTLPPSSARGQLDAAAVTHVEGMADCPPGSRGCRIASETGLICAAVRPNVEASPAAARLESVRPRGIDGNVKLLLSETP